MSASNENNEAHSDKVSLPIWLIIASVASVTIFVAFLAVGWRYYKNKKSKKNYKVEGKNEDQQKQPVHLNLTSPASRTYNSMSSSCSSLSESAENLYQLPGSSTKATKKKNCVGRTSSSSSAEQRALTQVHWNTKRTNYKSSNDDDTDPEDSSSTSSANGCVWLSVFHHKTGSKLIVYINKIKYLPNKGMNFNARTVFCRVYLLPDESNYLQSKTHKRTLTPKFHDTFMFMVNNEELHNKTLRISFYDVDKRKVRQSLGHILLPLNSVDLTTNMIFTRDLEIQQRLTNLGEIQLQLYCNPLADRLKVAITQITNIDFNREYQQTGMCVAVQLYHGRRLMKNKRSATVKLSTPNIFMDESFTFAVAARHIENCSIVISVLFVSLPDVDEYEYAKLVLGSFVYARGQQLAHWQEMTSNPRTVVTKRHKLEYPRRLQ